METIMFQQEGNIFFRPYFCGEAWVQCNRIQTDMGYGPFRIENKLTAMCGGGLDMATWCIFNCSRAVKLNEAGLEWSDDEEISSTQNMKGPLFMTFACNVGESL